MPSTLLTFVGHRDPSYTEPHEEGRLKGPVLTVLDERNFDRIVLFSRPHRREQAERLRAALREAHPRLAVETVELDLVDASHHPRILAALRPALARLRRAQPDDHYSISLLSGTPEVHACWVLLVTSGEFPARLLNLRRTVQNGLAGPRQLRVLDWREPLAAVNPDTLAMLSARRDRWDDPELQDPAAATPRRYFVRHSLEQAVQLGRSATPLLIAGEPGTQKQHLAALVHQIGGRADGPLVVCNCAAIPPAVFESALFGNAREENPGKLREADGGTLVLIKLQHVPAPLLRRLVKAVDQGHYYAPGSAMPVKANVRLVGTTDRDLADEVRRGRFPSDVWRRLQGGVVRLPPLRERPADIAALARDELERLNRSLPRPRRFSADALAKLEHHRWPSNISELRRVVEQACTNAEQTVIQPDDIDLDLSVNLANVFAHAVPRVRTGFSMEAYLRTIKLELVQSVLRKTGGNQSQAARLLGVTPQAVSKLLQAHAKPGRT